MILYQQGSPSSPHNQAEKVKAASRQHSGSQANSPVVPVMQINNTQESPSTSGNTGVKNKTAKSNKSHVSHQREALFFLVKVMLGQETLSFDEASLGRLPSSNFERFYHSNMINAALNAQTILFHLKTLFAKSKEMDPKQVTHSEHRNLKKSIYTAIASFFKAGMEYQRVSNILLGECKLLPEPIDKKQSIENPKKEREEEYKLLEVQKAVYDRRMRELHNKNIGGGEIDKILSDHLFSYSVVFPIKNIFPYLQPAEILEIIRGALAHQNHIASSPSFTQHNDEQSTILLTMPNLHKSEILQHHRRAASEVFWDSFNTELSPEDLKAKFEEFLFTNWGVCDDFRFNLQADLREATKNNNLQEKFKVLSQRLLPEKIQEIAVDLIKHILHVKHNHDQSKTKKGGKDWVSWQMQIEIAHKKIHNYSLAKILDCYEAHKKRKERWSNPNMASSFTEAEIKELDSAKRKMVKHTNGIMQEVNKTFPKHRTYVSHVLRILKQQGSIDLRTLLFLAENVKEDDISQSDASHYILGNKRSHDPQQTSCQPLTKRKKRISKKTSKISHLSKCSAMQSTGSFTNPFCPSQPLAKTPDFDKEPSVVDQENETSSSIALTRSVQFSPTRSSSSTQSAFSSIHSSSSTLSAFSPAQEEIQEKDPFLNQTGKWNLPLKMGSEQIAQVSSQLVVNEGLDLDIKLDFDTDLNIDIGRYLEGDNFDLFEDLDQYN